MISRHRFRALYYLGRISSFTLAGCLAGWTGAVFNLLLRPYHIPALTSFVFGGTLLMTGLLPLFKPHFLHSGLGARLSSLTSILSALILHDRAFSVFLFGFLTVLLPCGQTLVVWSACALWGDPWIGLWNGSAFACLTTPSLFLVMRTYALLKWMQPYYHRIVSLIAICVGALAICRGLAELNIIEHFILNQKAASEYHFVIY
jgi:sulfite exporter TauE/SafE